LQAGAAYFNTMSSPENSQAPDDRALTADKALVMGPGASLVIALLAGVAVWAVLNSIMPVFLLPERLAGLSGNLPEAQLQELKAAAALARQRNTMVALGAMASVLALTLAAAELFFRRQPVRAVFGGLLAGLIGGGVGVGAAVLGDLLMTSVKLENPLAKTMILQLSMLGLVGLGVGIAIAIPILRPRLLATCVSGGLLGGVLAAFLFPILVSFLPRVNTEQLVPDGKGLLLWIALAFGLIGGVMAGLGKEKPKPLPQAE
jgi:hypothetical protein